MFAVDRQAIKTSRWIKNLIWRSAIIRFPELLWPDLIDMTTHGRGGLRRLLIGSVAYNVVREAETAVLIYQPKAP